MPLFAVANHRYDERQVRINLYDCLRRISIEANLQSASLGQALGAVQTLPALSDLLNGVHQVTHSDAEYMEKMFDNLSLTR